MNKKYQDTIDTIVVIMLAIIAALVALCFTVATSKAMTISDGHNAYTGGGECHAYGTSTTVIKPVYDYCQSAVGTGKDAPRKHSDKRNNQGTTETTSIPTDTPKVNPMPVPTQEPPIIVDNKSTGNPGNTKDAGHAGEDPNGRGTMPLDNAGGNGNGEHGNQGQGGNSQP